MLKNLVQFGTINKKFLLPLILILAQLVFVVFNKYYKEPISNLAIQLFMSSFGQMSVKLLPLMLKISNDKEEKTENLIKQKKCKHYTILSLLFMANSGIIAGAILAEYYIADGPLDYTQSNLFPNNDSILVSIEMVFLIIISILLLKYKFYKHHIISMGIFFIFGIICEIILGTYNDIDGNFILFKIIRIVGIAVDATLYCYQKYMMEKYFYPYWNIGFVPGAVCGVASTGFLITILINKDKENSATPFISSFYKYFNEIDTAMIIVRIIVVFILHFIVCPLTILIIFYFSPNFILIISQFSRIFHNLFDNPPEKLFCIIFYIIQIIAMMIHLEVLELNFWGLNDFTKRNIDLRGIEDVSGEGRDSTVSLNKIDIDKDYSVKTEDMDNCIEMCEKEGEGEREGEEGE